MTPPPPKVFLRLLVKGVLFTSVWLVLCAGNFGSLIVGGPAIALALFLGELDRNPEHYALRPLRLISFIPFFLMESLRGGIDAALRVVPAKPRLHCGTVTFEFSLPAGTQRIFFANVIGLLPGTLTALFSDDVLIVHSLDSTKEVEHELLDLERRVAHLFGISDSD